MTLDLHEVLGQLADLVADRVAARLNGHGAPAVPGPDRLLEVDEAAAVLGVKPRWLYRHAARLPFTRRLSPRVVRFSEAGIRAYLTASRRGA